MGNARAIGENREGDITVSPRWKKQRMISGQGGSGVVDDKLNVPLEDAELLDEVELTTNLIIAASESESELTQEQVDRLLGVEPPSIPSQKNRDA
jgi:hypothetical protein